jgi:4-amino-4-deoxy-L-arabinose transferase-like glycosyltransferase
MQARLWAVLAGCAAVLILLVALRPLLPIDETRYLSVAWEMWLSGDPVHLTKNGASYTHKTPPLFLLINAVWLVTGVSEFAARLVGPACALGMLAGTAVLARRFWPSHTTGRDKGPLAALVLAGFPVFLIYGSATMFDALLALAVLGGVAALWQIGQGAAGWRSWAGFGLALAFGTFAKGPVILVHLAPLLLTLPIWAPAPPRAGAVLRGTALALGVALVLVALWLVPTLATATPDFRQELLWTQSAARVAGGMAHDRPFWFLAALVPVLLFPWGWSLALWRAMAGRWRADPAVRLCRIWALSSLLLFSVISGKQAHYLLPTFPAVALLITDALSRTRTSGFWLNRGAWAPLMLVALASALVGAQVIEPKGDLALLAPYWPVLLFALLCLGLVAALWRLPLMAGHLVAGLGVALGLHGIVAGTALYAAYDGRPIAAKLANAEAQGLAVTDANYHAEFNFLARLGQPVAQPQTQAEWEAWASTHPDGLIFGRVGTPVVAGDPAETRRYMGHSLGFWPATAISRE